MIGRNFRYNGVEIPYSTDQAIEAGWYADIKWTGVSVRNNITPLQGWHGAIARPTFSEGKLIEISGQIFSTDKTRRGEIKNVLADLFKLEDFPDEENSFKALDFEDDDGVVWTIPCKVYTMPEYDNERADPIINFSLQLYAQDPLLRSRSPNIETGIYGDIQGISFPVQFPVQFLGLLNPVICENEGNFAASTLVSIVGDIVNPRVYNYTTNKYFKINTSLSGSDELIINSGDGTAKLNGVNILANRAAGSNWIFLQKGINQIMLLGDDFDPGDQDKARISVEWYHTKIV